MDTCVGLGTAIVVLFYQSKLQSFSLLNALMINIQQLLSSAKNLWRHYRVASSHKSSEYQHYSLYRSESLLMKTLVQFHTNFATTSKIGSGDNSTYAHTHAYSYPPCTATYQVQYRMHRRVPSILYNRIFGGYVVTRFLAGFYYHNYRPTVITYSSYSWFTYNT